MTMLADSLPGGPTVTRLDDAQIQARLAPLTGWQRLGQEIRKTFQFPNFPAAIAFVNQVAEEAEGADHHPDIDIRYRQVTLALSTHSAGGLTEKDFDLAEVIERIQNRGS
jgi:4a-hydroxytetrahydrobiopterin dehydratase